MDNSCNESVPQFDRYAGQRWIYPTNMKVRAYQMKAVQLALFNNTMIVLPTGFGKTFIAAVVMYNFHRWYPNGKIIFVAPTRPLVNQQIVECKKISGIPPSDCIELTGSINPTRRQEYWLNKRVFFATPQVIQNDLEQLLLPARQVKCLVIDEAHRAQGGYAYVELVRLLQEQNKDAFRIVALSATPGSTIEKVRQVMLNLYIGEVMFRSEQSIDLMPYRNQKISKAWTVELVGRHADFVRRFIKMCQPAVGEISKTGLLWSGQDSLDRLKLFGLIKLQKEIDINNTARNKRGRLMFVVAALMTMKYCFDLLTNYGIRPFYGHLSDKLKSGNIRSLIGSNPDSDKLMQDIQTLYGKYIVPNPNEIVDDKTIDLLTGHPKLRVVKETLESHFEKNADRPDSRAMVFCKYRESVYDIVQTLKSSSSIVKPHIFVGQKIDERKLGLRQKEQLNVVQEFKRGECNTLVATCVAEEGLDIGELDLVICYDSSSDVISGTQRRGRTGRKRAGDVAVLLTKDYEESKFKKASQTKRQVEEQLFKRENYMTFKYVNAPRMVPNDIEPICLEQFVQPVIDDQEVEKKSKRCKRSVGVIVSKSSSCKKIAKCGDACSKIVDEPTCTKAIENDDLHVGQLDGSQLTIDQKFLDELDEPMDDDNDDDWL